MLTTFGCVRPGEHHLEGGGEGRSIAYIIHSERKVYTLKPSWFKRVFSKCTGENVYKQEHMTRILWASVQVI